MKKKVNLYLGADHAGHALKESIKKYLEKKRVSFEDLGGNGKAHDDYPEYAHAISKKVVKTRTQGILICGTGTGMVIAANRHKGIRAQVGYDTYSAKMGRHDNDTNVLCLRARRFSEKENLKIVRIWLSTPFSKLARHKRRISKIEGGKK